ncbi:MAG: lipid asymmetry maintenance protein MlaB [Candidatus Tectimicrobiota bacterium]
MLQIQCDVSATRHQLRLAGELTIYTAAAFMPQLCQILPECPALELHLGQINELDTAGVQQLLLARREAARLGKVLRLVEPSAATREVLAFLQLEAAFQTAEAS